MSIGSQPRLENASLTFLFRNFLQVNQQTNIILLLLLRSAADQPFAILALQHLIHAVPREIGPTLDADREHELGLGRRCGEVEADVVVVYKVDIDSAGSDGECA